MSPSTVRAWRSCERRGGGSGFSSGVSEGSHYHQGKLAALSLQSWPRSLLFVVANTDNKSSISGASPCLVSVTDLTAPLYHCGTPKYIYNVNSSIWLKYALLYCCWWLILLCREVLGEPVIRLCIHSRNPDHSLIVCSLMLLCFLFFCSLTRQLHFPEYFSRKRPAMLYLWALTRFKCDISFP